MEDRTPEEDLEVLCEEFLASSSENHATVKELFKLVHICQIIVQIQVANFLMCHGVNYCRII